MRRSSPRASGASKKLITEEKDDMKASPGTSTNEGSSANTPKPYQTESKNYHMEVDLIIQRGELDTISVDGVNTAEHKQASMLSDTSDQVHEHDTEINQESEKELSNHPHITSAETKNTEGNATVHIQIIEDVLVRSPVLMQTNVITQQDIDCFLDNVCNVEQSNVFLKPGTPASQGSVIGSDKDAADTSCSLHKIDQIPSGPIQEEKEPTKDPIILTSNENEHIYNVGERIKVDIIGSDDGPKMYNVKGNYVSPPFITGKLPEAFSSLPVFQTTERDFQEHKKAFLKKFVGGDIDEEQFSKLEQYCSPSNLQTGHELTMLTEFPVTTFSAITENKEFLSNFPGNCGEADHLKTMQRYLMRAQQDKGNCYAKRLKYRGYRFMTLGSCVAETFPPAPPSQAPPLQPGRDLLYRVRVYRPFPYNPHEPKRARSTGRHPLFCYDIVLLGRHTLEELRDRIRCPNDVGLRVDRSQRTGETGEHVSCKELFPSGFLFINNVFYVDGRARCRDLSAPLREWARRRGLGDFRAADMATVTLDQLTIRLGYPEVYVHQGSCEHLFTFSSVRLCGVNSPAPRTALPAHTAAAPPQTAHCGACERAAARVVTGATNLPFHPALFCAECADMYLYDAEGNKMADFQAYPYHAGDMRLNLP